MGITILLLDELLPCTHHQNICKTVTLRPHLSFRSKKALHIDFVGSRFLKKETNINPSDDSLHLLLCEWLQVSSYASLSYASPLSPAKVVKPLGSEILGTVMSSKMWEIA
ncbi:uncharacterized protein LOC108862638 [Raphanus sativus]|uniref:Uncharacterized protein LOC108862638 n=1 Tax=Raphanus sativus TaxID=3726 RepID=A0A6J0P6I4_RAPSA|nr:uncharacterized protein LOC108862638 [Raphanus sativus]